MLELFPSCVRCCRSRLCSVYVCAKRVKQGTVVPVWITSCRSPPSGKPHEKAAAEGLPPQRHSIELPLAPFREKLLIAHEAHHVLPRRCLERRPAEAAWEQLLVGGGDLNELDFSVFQSV